MKQQIQRDHCIVLKEIQVWGRKMTPLVFTEGLIGDEWGGVEGRGTVPTGQMAKVQIRKVTRPRTHDL